MFFEGVSYGGIREAFLSGGLSRIRIGLLQPLGCSCNSWSWLLEHLVELTFQKLWAFNGARCRFHVELFRGLQRHGVAPASIHVQQVFSRLLLELGVNMIGFLSNLGVRNEALVASVNLIPYIDEPVVSSVGFSPPSPCVPPRHR